MPLLKKILNGLKKLFQSKKRPTHKLKSSKRAKRSTLKSTKSSVIKKPKLLKRKKSVVKKKIVRKTAKAKNKSVKAAIAKPDKEKLLRIGEVTHYFSKIGVVVIKIRQGPLRVGDKIKIEGRGQSFVQAVQSLQIESVDVASAKKGDLVGMKVTQAVKEGDKVFKIK